MNYSEQNYWTKRYRQNLTGWDIGYPSTPIKTYISQLEDKEIKILIPGAGNGYEAEYIYDIGFKNVYILDISAYPLQKFKERNPQFPKKQLLHEDFFKHSGQYDLIIEQTFFCSFLPTQQNRTNYAQKMSELLKPNGKLVGLWFNIPLTKNMEKRPFGGNKELYEKCLTQFLTKITFENCHNSIKERANKEFFGIFKKKN